MLYKPQKSEKIAIVQEATLTKKKIVPTLKQTLTSIRNSLKIYKHLKALNFRLQILD